MKYYQEKINNGGTIAVDDMILVKGYPTTAGSRMLGGFRSLFSAEAVTRLENKGYTVAGKTAVGEFGLDLVGEFSYSAEQDGTLAGAAASLVKNGEVKAALAVDMNGTPRRAASQSDVLFLKPTYGTVSRYGIVSCAASGEQVGVYADNTDTVAEIMGIIAGHDDKDGTSLRTETYEYKTDIDITGKKVAILNNLVAKADEATKQNIADFADKLQQCGVAVTSIDADTIEQANVAWQILMSAETCNNISRFDGVKFGYRSENFKTIDELYINSRTEGMNFLTKSVILYGSDVLSKTRYEACYDKSLKVRRVVAAYFESLFAQYDAVLLPACSQTPYEQYDIKDGFAKVFSESIFTSSANLVGLPALVGCGVQLMGNHFGENILLGLMKNVQERRN